MDELNSVRKIRIGMIGASPDTFIGNVHHMVSRMDGLYSLVSGTFSRDFNKTKTIGKSLGIDDSRLYKDWEDFLNGESKIEKENRIDVVSIVTPNNLHYAPAKRAIELGFHVILDKPLCLSVKEALDLEQTIKANNQLFCLTHTYTGYPMIKEAREIIKSNKLGKVRKVTVDYPQGWLSKKVEDFNSVAKNRQDPNITGVTCTLGDVGTHAENMLEYVTGLEIVEVCADVSILVDGRLLDDDSSVLLRLNNGAKGVLLAGQALAGEENGLTIKVWGEEGGLEWKQSDNNTLRLKWLEKPEEILKTGSGYSYLSEAGRAHSRLPGGHPEGYLEAFANIYRNFGYAVLSKISNYKYNAEVFDFPNIKDGVRGMLFIEKVLESSKSDQKWVKY